MFALLYPCLFIDSPPQLKMRGHQVPEGDGDLADGFWAQAGADAGVEESGDSMCFLTFKGK